MGGDAVKLLGRIKAAWRALRGKVYIPTAPKVIYVQQEVRRGFVQLMYFEGRVLALDGDGNLWCIMPEYGPNAFTCSLVMDGPRR
jgi:hypothetical protein